MMSVGSAAQPTRMTTTLIPYADQLRAISA